jgi:two-component system, OmpR family, alkaline phosphatase synthesis response regulator PhoP
MSNAILVIEDNAALAAGIRSNLEFEGYAVTVAATGREGLRLAQQGDFALILLDLMLPDIDGFRVLREARDAGVDTPVLILTALGDEADKVRGFRFGADDYVTKPFGLMELLARVDALLRRSRGSRGASNSATIVFGEVQVHCATREVWRAGTAVPLRPKEFDLLLALIRREQRLVSRDVLLREVWGYDGDVVSRTVDTHIAELRRKLERDPAAPEYLLTVRKAGYRLVLPSPSPSPSPSA